MKKIVTDGRDCVGCKLWSDFASHCTIRDIDATDYCPCRLCPVKVMCNDRVTKCPQFMINLRIVREKHKNEM